MKLAALLVAMMIGAPLCAIAGQPTTINDKTNTYTMVVDASGAHFVCDSGCGGGGGSVTIAAPLGTQTIPNSVAVTNADGTLVTLGLKADVTSPCTVSSPTSCTAQQQFAEMSQLLNSILTSTQNGTALFGVGNMPTYGIAIGGKDSVTATTFSAFKIDNTTGGLITKAAGPTATTPAAGTASAIVTNATAVTMVTGPVSGCYITNPLSAADQNIATAEVGYVNPVTTATVTGRGTTVTLQPGQTFSCVPGQTTNVSVNAATQPHAFTVIVW